MITQTKGIWTEFKAFALKGNVLELAVAVLVGTAFSGIVNSLATDILGPFIALATGSVDFKTLEFAVRPGLVVRYGLTLQAIFNFLVVAVSIFMVMKALQLFRR